MRKYVIFLITIFFHSINTFSQDIPLHYNHSAIYSFLDELANEKIIEINTVVKPYSRTYILEQLQIAKSKLDQNQVILTKRQLKDLEYYLRIYSFNSDTVKNTYSESAKVNIFKNMSSNFSSGINPLGIFYKDSLFTFSFKPIWGIRYYAKTNRTIRHTWGGFEAYGTIHKNWTIYFNLRDNYQTHVLAFPDYYVQNEGGNYKLNEGGRIGGDYSEMRGGILYSWRWGSFGITKDHIQWGNNYHGANIFSGRTPSFGIIKLHISPVKWLDFHYFHGWLVSEVIDSTRSYITSIGDVRKVYRDRYIAANIYSFKPFKSFHFSIGNSIVYSDGNPQIVYLIPFLFYKSIDHTYNHGIDNHNSQMFGDFSFRMIKHFHLYGTIFIDDFSATRIMDDERQNFIGRKFGARVSNWPLKNTILTFEYTKTNPIVYKHRIPSLRFEMNQFNLGHYLRDNSEEYYTSIIYKPIRGLQVKISYVNTKHGNEYQYTDGPRAELYKFMEDITWQKNTCSLEFLYEFISEGYIFLDISSSNVKGFSVDGYSAQYYLDYYTPSFFQGNNQIITLGFNIGF